MLDLFDSLTDERARVEKRVTVARQCLLHAKLLIVYIFSHINIFFSTSYLFLYQNILSFIIFFPISEYSWWEYFTHSYSSIPTSLFRHLPSVFDDCIANLLIARFKLFQAWCGICLKCTRSILIRETRAALCDCAFCALYNCAHCARRKLCFNAGPICVRLQAKQFEICAAHCVRPANWVLISLCMSASKEVWKHFNCSKRLYLQPSSPWPHCFSDSEPEFETLYLMSKTRVASFRLEMFRVSASGTLRADATWRAEPHRIAPSPSSLGFPLLTWWDTFVNPTLSAPYRSYLLLLSVLHCFEENIQFNISALGCLGVTVTYYSYSICSEPNISVHV